MDKHACQFVVLTEIDKIEDPLNNSRRVVPGVVVACPICGEVREVYRDGDVRVTKKKWEATVSLKK